MGCPRANPNRKKVLFVTSEIADLVKTGGLGDVPRTARERARAEVMAELLAAANARLGTDGAAALSLRAIARDLGMASSAVYRYVDSRDALLTLLIIDGYDAAGQACEEAAAAARARGDSPAQVWRAVARALRGWALAHPHTYELMLNGLGR